MTSKNHFKYRDDDILRFFDAARQIGMSVSEFSELIDSGSIPTTGRHCSKTNLPMFRIGDLRVWESKQRSAADRIFRRSERYSAITSETGMQRDWALSASTLLAEC